MKHELDFRLENRKTGETFDCYAHDICKAQKLAVKCLGGNVKDWQERPINGFFR